MNETENQHKEEEGTTPQSTSSPSSSSSSSSTITVSSSPKVEKGKSCKGTLYYSSTLKSKSRNPLCVGFTKSLSHVPRYIEQSKFNDSMKGKNPTDFRFGCVGYSLYKDCQNQPNDAPDSQTGLPLCVGLEILVDRRPSTEESGAVIHNKEGESQRRPQPQQPAHPFGDEFLGKFTRNANLVAMGVVKNLRKVGNHIKDSVENILYPYRRPPK